MRLFITYLLIIFQVSKLVKLPKKYRVPKQPYVTLKKPLLLTKEEDIEDKDKEEDNNVQVISTNKFPSSSSYQLNILKCAINTTNSNLRKDVNSYSYINCVLQGKRYVCAKGISSKQVPTSYIKYKSYSNKSISYYKVSLYF